MNELTPRARKIRDIIDAYLSEKFEEKAGKIPAQITKLNEEIQSLEAELSTQLESSNRSSLEDKHAKALTALETMEETYQKLSDQFSFSTWLRAKAKSSRQIQVVTHPAKATFPDAKIRTTTSLFIPPSEIPETGYITSGELGKKYLLDVTGNAAQLDLAVLLLKNFEETTLLELCVQLDPDMLRALSDDEEDAKKLIENFRSLIQPRTPGISASFGVKQILWCKSDDATDDQAYNVLSPLYPSHLSTHIFNVIQEDRYGKNSKEDKTALAAARKARREKKYSERSLTYYPQLAKTQIGGSNAQNVSRLNSVRNGINYRFAGLPPVWKTEPQRPLYGHKSLFIPFGRQRTVRQTISEFRRFLESDPPSNVHTRRKVVRFTNELIDALVGFVASYQTLEPGWTKHAYCQLPRAQQAWLDPWRAVKDDKFYKRWITYEWVNVCGQHFASWLNRELGKTLPMGDIEHRHWRKEFDIEDGWSASIERSRKAISTLEQEVSS